MRASDKRQMPVTRHNVLALQAVEFLPEEMSRVLEQTSYMTVGAETINSCEWHQPLLGCDRSELNDLVRKFRE